LGEGRRGRSAEEEEYRGRVGDAKGGEDKREKQLIRGKALSNSPGVMHEKEGGEALGVIKKKRETEQSTMSKGDKRVTRS